MRAERDEDEFQARVHVRKVPERRLASEVAIGIIVGGSVLWAIEGIAGYIVARMMLSGMQMNFPI
jgi:hypothetical protein